MEFLCAYHRRQLGRLPTGQQQELWLLWMEHAQRHYQCEEPRDAILLSGCAFELASVSMELAQGDRMTVELTLSAIFNYQLLHCVGNQVHAEQLMRRALDLLQAEEAAPVVTFHRADSVTYCRQALRDPSRHGDFFLNYLNWPVFWQKQPASSQPAWIYY